MPAARALREIDGFRVSFDVRPPENGSGSIELRLFLHIHGARPHGKLALSVDTASGVAALSLKAR